MRRALIRVTGISLGSTGIAVCLVLIVLAWIAGNRLGQGTDRLFSSADRALVAVRQHVVQTRERVAASTEAAENIERSLPDWARQEVSQRQASQQDLTAKSERLVSALQQAQGWLEVAEASVGLVTEALANGALASPPARTTALDGLTEELGNLRAQLTQAAEVVDGIRDRVTDQSSDPLESRIEQGVLLARRVAATLGSLDSRFGQVEERLTTAHSQVQDLGARVQSWIVVATIGVTLFLLWMAAGQLALCRLVWFGLGIRRPAENAPNP